MIEIETLNGYGLYLAYDAERKTDCALIQKKSSLTEEQKSIIVSREEWENNFSNFPHRTKIKIHMVREIEEFNDAKKSFRTIIENITKDSQLLLSCIECNKFYIPLESQNLKPICFNCWMKHHWVDLLDETYGFAFKETAGRYDKHFIYYPVPGAIMCIINAKDLYINEIKYPKTETMTFTSESFKSYLHLREEPVSADEWSQYNRRQEKEAPFFKETRQKALDMVNSGQAEKLFIALKMK